MDADEHGWGMAAFKPQMTRKRRKGASGRDAPLKITKPCPINNLLTRLVHSASVESLI